MLTQTSIETEKNNKLAQITIFDKEGLIELQAEMLAVMLRNTIFNRNEVNCDHNVLVTRNQTQVCIHCKISKTTELKQQQSTAVIEIKAVAKSQQVNTRVIFKKA